MFHTNCTKPLGSESSISLKNMYYPSTTYKVMPPNDKLVF
jgi:hypothetical protein